MASAPLLHGRFRLVRRVGAGAHGEVYEAFDEQLSARVAVKLLSRADPSTIARFKQEFRLLAGIAHPNLVALHELFGDGERFAFSMELLEGVPFRAFVRREAGSVDVPTLDAGALPLPRATPGEPLLPLAGQLDEARLRDALGQLASAVLALHAAGRLHRDLKPGNVLVTAAGRLVVLDFGLVEPLAPGRGAGNFVSVDGALRGTPLYMAPEQAALAPASPASDWYAVGVMLYEALTGAPPFAGAAIDVLAQKQRFDPIDPLLRARNLPPDLCTLALDLLRRDAPARPSGEEVARRLSLSVPALSQLPSRRAGASLSGREAELQQLSRALAGARAGRASVLLLSGPAGSGKTALARAFLDALEARGEAMVLEGRGWARESVAGSALDTLLEALARLLRRLPAHEALQLVPAGAMPLLQSFPPLSRVPALAEAATVQRGSAPPAREALRELLGRLARRFPLVLFLDDLHWGDAESGEILRAVLAPPDAPMLLVIAAFRSGATVRAPVPRALSGSPGLLRDELVLGPLPDEAMRALLEPLLPGGRGPRAPLAAALAAQARGSPFLARLLVRALKSPEGAAAEEPPPALAQVLARRIARLPPEEALLLSLLAAAEGPIPRATLRVASGLRERSERPLLALTAGKFVQSLGAGAGDLLDLFHPAIRESARASTQADELVRLRERLRAAGPT